MLALTTLLTRTPSSFQLLRAGAASRPLVEAGELWRLFSAGFLLPGSWLGLALALYTLVALGSSLERERGSSRLLLVFALSSLLGTSLAVLLHPARLVATGAGSMLGLVVAEAVARRRFSPESLPWVIVVGLWGYQGSYPLACLIGALGGLLPLARVPLGAARATALILVLAELAALAQGQLHPSLESYPTRRYQEAHFAFAYPGFLRASGPLLVGPGFTLEITSNDNGEEVNIPAQLAHLAKRFSDSGQTLRSQKPDEWSLNGRNWMSLAGQAEGLYTRVAFAQAGTRVYRITLSAAPADATAGEAALRTVLLSFEMPGAPAPPQAPALTAEQHVQQGMAALRQRDFKAAQAHFDQALAEDPKSTEALLSRAMVRLGQNDLEGALRDVEGPVQANPLDYRGLLLRAKILGQKKEFDRSLADLGRVLELVSGQPQVEATALRERAEVYLLRGDRAAAVSDLERALSLHPADPALKALLEEARR